MVSYEELKRLLRQKPFRPFRVILRDGRHYDVHPRMNLLAETYVNIGIPAPDLTPPICDHTEHVRLADIDRIEDLSSDGSPVPS
jgi:hypothetical protein